MLKIALVAPFEEPVPPRTYGGTERVVFNLAEELVNMGYDVTLLASGDSKTSAKLIPCVTKAVRMLPEAKNPDLRSALNLQGLAQAVKTLGTGNYDIVHNHFGWKLLLFKDLIKAPIITTLHGNLSEPTEQHMHGVFKNEPFVSISKSQRRHGAKLHYVATVYNGIQPERFKFNPNPQDYLAFLGRIHPHKGLEYAIEIAKKSNHKLIIAAKLDSLEQHYFENEIKPLIDGKQIVFIGEVDHKKKVSLLKNAKAMLSPIQWDEPFGITNIESMACGTPVIGIKRGSLSEIIVDGKTGYLCSNVDQMIKRVQIIDRIKRETCRHHVEKHFSARGMAEGYLKAYGRIVKL